MGKLKAMCQGADLCPQEMLRAVQIDGAEFQMNRNEPVWILCNVAILQSGFCRASTMPTTTTNILRLDKGNMTCCKKNTKVYMYNEEIQSHKVDLSI